MEISAKKRVVGIAFITAAMIMGDAMLLIVLPIYWQEFGLTAIWQIGLLLSINRFIRLPINPLVGIFYTRFHLRTGIFIAVLIAIITTFSYGIFQQFWLLFIMRALWGVAWSLLRLGGFLTIIDVADDSNRGKYVGMYNGLWGIGGLIGMLAGGFLVDQTSITFVTTLFALLGLFTVPAVWTLVPAIKATNTDKKTTSKKQWFTPYVGMVLITGTTMGFIIFGLFASTLSQLVERSYTTEWTVLQITIGAATVAGIIQALRWGWDPFLAPLIGKWLDSTHARIRILLFPLFAGGLVMIFLANLQSIQLLIAALLVFQLLSTIFVTTTDMLATSAAAKTDRVKVVTAHTVVIDVGAALGPLVSFVLIDFYNITVVYYISAFILIGLGIAWISSNAKA